MCFHPFPRLAQPGCASESPEVLVKRLLLRRASLPQQNPWSGVGIPSALWGARGHLLSLPPHALLWPSGLLCHTQIKGLHIPASFLTPPGGCWLISDQINTLLSCSYPLSHEISSVLTIFLKVISISWKVQRKCQNNVRVLFHQQVWLGSSDICFQ